MILQSLVDYYEHLIVEYPDSVASFGWCSRQVNFMLELSPEGKLIGAIPCDEKRGWTRIVPMTSRTSGSDKSSAGFCCDTAEWLLGIPENRDANKQRRALNRFASSRERHLELLNGLSSPSAMALRSFFGQWNPEKIGENRALKRIGFKDRLVFCVKGKEVLRSEDIREAWNKDYLNKTNASDKMICLVSGAKEPIARTHPDIKKTGSDKPSKLVSFDKESTAFSSYGHDGGQGFNAPVSEYAAFAYATALNYLLSDREHHTKIGDTTVVYWADRSDKACVNIFTQFLNPLPRGGYDDNVLPRKMERKLDRIMKAVAKGHKIKDVDFKATFYVLGLAPNAARLSVRFFHRSTFGDVLGNVGRHYERLDIARPPYEMKYLSPYRLLEETERGERRGAGGTKGKKKKQGDAISVLGGALMRSILDDLPYPEALYNNVILRIRATDSAKGDKVTCGRAAIIKAYLIKNCGREDITVELNESTGSTPYVLGRLFAVLEKTQEYAAWIDDGKKPNFTITSRFFNSACATPEVAFPTILKLNQAHLDKLRKQGKDLRYARQIAELCKMAGKLPKRLTNQEQGEFILGYWCQRQSYFEKNSESTQTKEA